MKTLTKTEIITETMEFFTKDVNRRALGNNATCYYFHKRTKNRCAIGRCMKLKEAKLVDNGLTPHMIAGFQDTLQSKYKGHNLDFWDKLQSFHDFDHYWNKKGLTNQGKGEYQELLKIFNH